MAKVSATGFAYRKNLMGAEESQSIIRFRVANSTTLKVGDMVRVNTAGFLVKAGVNNPVVGVVNGLVNQNGGNPFALGVDAAGASLTPGDQLVTSSTNQTAATWIEAEVRVDPGGYILYYGTLNSGTLAQTNLLQFYNLVAASDQADSSTNSDTTGIVQLLQLDPDGDGNVTKGLFRIATPQLISQVGNSTQVVNA